MFLFIIFSYIFLNLIIAYITYTKLRPFYPGHNNPIHNRFPEFNRKDTLSFPKLYFGLLFLVWPRLILTVIILTILSIVLTINKHNPKLYPCKDAFYRLCIHIVVFLLGGIIPKWKLLTHECRAVYSKYLGADYFDNTALQTKRFAGIVSNHISYIDVFIYATKYTCSFIGKKTIEKIPIVSTIAKYTNTIFFDRIKESDRSTTAKEIIKQQHKVLNGEVRTPILVFPEGTVSMGRNILQFKRGAFMSCLPLKPFVELIDQDENTFELANGVLPLAFHLIHALSQVYINVTILDLPVVQPTTYMLEQYAHFGKEKWMVYREVTRRIMAEVSGLELSDKGFQEKLEYISMIKGKKVKNT